MTTPNAINDSPDAPQDQDPEETREWLDALASTLAACGPERARYLLKRLEEYASEHGIHRDAIALASGVRIRVDVCGERADRGAEVAPAA